MGIVKRSVLSGSILSQNSLVTANHPIVSIPGRFNECNSLLTLDEELLSKHLMLIGGTGCGKSNVFYHIVSQIKRKMTPDDVMIVFDTKGDYYKQFATTQDFVLGASKSMMFESAKWNIFREILSDGWDHDAIELNIQELTWTLFRESIERSKDPFFPNAARDLFSAILYSQIKAGENDGAYKKEFFYNVELKKALSQGTLEDVRVLISSSQEVSSVLSYIGDGKNNQALGVFAEMLSTTRKLLISSFADKGSFSVRNFVRERGGRTLFIEYDMAIGSTLAPVYSVLIDLALKEAMGRSSNKGNVYLICDEFRLLPFLKHIDDAVNFGRSIGIKVIAGLQSINQLTEAYGEYKGKNVLAGFSTILAFRANDAYTRDYFTSMFGKNLVVEQYKTIANTIHEEKKEANVVEDWDMNELNVGEAVIGFPFERPFKFCFDLYQKGVF